jgi:hypothetical protein
MFPIDGAFCGSVRLGLLEFGLKDGIDAWSFRHEGTSLESG